MNALAFGSAFWFSFSIPGNDMAIFLKRLLTLCPALAEVSMNMMFSCCDFAVASSSVTWLVSIIIDPNGYKQGKSVS